MTIVAKSRMTGAGQDDPGIRPADADDLALSAASHLGPPGGGLTDVALSILLTVEAPPRAEWTPASRAAHQVGAGVEDPRGGSARGAAERARPSCARCAGARRAPTPWVELPAVLEPRAHGRDERRAVRRVVPGERGERRERDRPGVGAGEERQHPLPADLLEGDRRPSRSRGRARGRAAPARGRARLRRRATASGSTPTGSPNSAASSSARASVGLLEHEHARCPRRGRRTGARRAPRRAARAAR